jgi:hypothetical protein
MGDPKAIRRDQLAKFIPDNETILRFQRLFQVAGDITPSIIEEIVIGSESNASNSASNEALIEALKQDYGITLAVLAAQINEIRSQIANQNSSNNLERPFFQIPTPRIDYVDFNRNLLTTEKTGRLIWNDEDGTLNVGLTGEVTLQVGQETHYYARNTSGATVDNGTPVMFTGTVGASGKLEFGLAESDPSIPVEYFMGIATEDIDNNDYGYVTHFGLVRGFDTSGTPVGEVWSDGDLLYLSTTAGELTITPPTAPDPKILVAAVIYANSSQGSIFVRPRWGDYLSQLHDVFISGIADNDLIAWDNANQRWTNTSDPVVDTITVNDNIIMSGTTGEGIEVDPATPTFGWQDMLGPITIRGIAATDPSYPIYRDGLRAYQFALNDVVWNEYHILHDYVPGTDLYIHAHWSHNSATVTSGSVTWSFEISYAKGHDQAPFPASKTITVTQAGSTTQYQHMIAEVAFTAATADATHFDRDDIEIDGLVLVKTELTANTLNAATDPFLHMVDIHYQTTNIGSKNKAPNFYVT